MTQEKIFSEVTRKIKLLNPEANIGISSKSTEVIWSEVPADQLVLPPNTDYKGETADKQGILKYAGHCILVRAYGSNSELMQVSRFRLALHYIKCINKGEIIWMEN